MAEELWKRMFGKQIEYNKFVSWFNGVYGVNRAIERDFNVQNFMQTQEYQYWTTLGKPATGTEPVPIEEKPTGLTDEEWEAKLRDRTQKPGTPPEGAEWKYVTQDPATGRPLSEPSWTLSPEKKPKKPEPDPFAFDKLRLEETKRANLASELTARQQGFDLWQEREQQRMDEQAKRQAQQVQSFANRETSRMGWLLGAGRDMGIPPERTEQAAQMFNQWQQQRMAQLSPNADWIKRWEIKNEPNPYQPRITNFKDEMDFVRSELRNVREVVRDEETTKKELAAEAKARQQEAPDFMGRSPSGIQAAFGASISKSTWSDTQEQNLQLARDVRGRLSDRLGKAEEEFLSEEAPFTISEPTMMGGRMIQPAQPGSVGGSITGPGSSSFRPEFKTPPVPAWMAPMISQEAGEPIQKGVDQFTPSPQWLRQTPLGQQQRMAGWQEWSQPGSAAQSIRRMQSMLPQEPSFGRQWAAPRQRV